MTLFAAVAWDGSLGAPRPERKSERNERNDPARDRRGRTSNARPSAPPTRLSRVAGPVFCVRSRPSHAQKRGTVRIHPAALTLGAPQNVNNRVHRKSPSTRSPTVTLPAILSPSKRPWKESSEASASVCANVLMMKAARCAPSSCSVAAATCHAPLQPSMNGTERLPRSRMDPHAGSSEEAAEGLDVSNRMRLGTVRAECRAAANDSFQTPTSVAWCMYRKADSADGARVSRLQQEAFEFLRRERVIVLRLWATQSPAASHGLCC
jgi:hypothetical protein